MKQPRISGGTLKARGKVVLLRRAQIGNPNGGFLWENHRKKKLKEWNWIQLRSESGALRYDDPSKGACARLIASTDDFIM